MKIKIFKRYDWIGGIDWTIYSQHASALYTINYIFCSFIKLICNVRTHIARDLLARSLEST